ncbi:MAG: type III-A CRISPR-associated protein Cas10/Csm1 [Methanobrevibacter sp.]|jgi:CRISPR-associated protein Csm1|nr:type III-A CRISPR-associated protein Cas10/Csm1 [Methanobrevibacter sp.]
MELENIKMAALLHDIGKFYQRTDKPHSEEFSKLTTDNYGENGAHGKWSATFIDKYNLGEDVKDITLYHHMPNNSNNPQLTKIVQKADHHASSERIKSEKNDGVKKEPLRSIFSRVNLDGRNKLDNESFLPLEQLSLEKYGENFNDYYNKITPKKGKNVNLDYLALWNKFEGEFKKLNTIGLDSDFNTTLSLLKKYTSTMHSAAYRSVADISLFDHLKTTAALATSRYIFSKDGHERLKKKVDDQKVYLVINGDISGIQKFIYRVSSPQDAQAGMSKRLRGRSLYINLLNDSIASKITNDLGLNQSNILFCGGGRFVIVAANTKNIIEKLNELRHKINKMFIDKFNAELYLAVAYEESSGNDLERFGDITSKLNTKLTLDKKQKFINQLEEVFKLEESVNYDKTCSVCGKPTKSENGICAFCKDHENLGQVVTNAKFMIKAYSKNKASFNFYEKDLGIGYKFLGYTATLEFIENLKNDFPFEKLEIIKLNDTEFLDKDILQAIGEVKASQSIRDSNKISLGFNFLGNTVPRHSKYPLYFEHLAQISTGANKLGIVKMDVDNLGKIFTSGFKSLEEDKKDKDGNVITDGEGNPIKIKGATISRISTLSSQLDMFFSGFINKIAENYRVFPKLCPDCEEKIKNGQIKKIKLNLQKDDDSYRSFKPSIGDGDSFYVYKELDKNNKEAKVCSECEKKSISTIHINYSGGDDLLVLGPYDDIMEFSKEFRDKFRKWTCENPSITLSAGINIVDAKFPIGKAAIKSDDFLECSKSCGEDKDKITAFNDVIRWEENGNSRGYYDLLAFGQKLEDYTENEKISRGMLYDFLRLWQETFKNFDDPISNKEEWNEDLIKRMSKKRYIPKFKYKLRLIKDSKIRDEIDKNGIKYMPWIKIPVSWASLRTR